MKEAVSEEDYNRWDKGLPSQKEVTQPRPEPIPPKVDDVITLKKVKYDDIKVMLDGRRKSVKNKNGVRFMGFAVAWEAVDGKIISGWMFEADYIEFRRELFRSGKVNCDLLEF
jgi:hypothetical protein